MGTLRIAVDDEPVFTWEGDEAAVANLREIFPQHAAQAGMTARAFAAQAMRNAPTLLKREDTRQTVMAAITWCVLDLDTRNPEHPGKIADYIGCTSFDVNIRLREDGGYDVEMIRAVRRYDA